MLPPKFRVHQILTTAEVSQLREKQPCSTVKNGGRRQRQQSSHGAVCGGPGVRGAPSGGVARPGVGRVVAVVAAGGRLLWTATGRKSRATGEKEPGHRRRPPVGRAGGPPAPGRDQGVVEVAAPQRTDSGRRANPATTVARGAPLSVGAAAVLPLAVTLASCLPTPARPLLVVEHEAASNCYYHPCW